MKRALVFICALITSSALIGADAIASGESALNNRWELVFSDDFDRDAIGDEWKVYAGEWGIENGSLVGRGEIYVNRSFPGNQRVEFSAESDNPNDLSPFIHAGEVGFASGYFLQFGGMGNELNVARRLGKDISVDYWHMIVPGQVHKIVAEFDGTHVRLTVDGETVHEYEEKNPLQGESHQRVGFYVYNKSRIHDVKIYLQKTNDGEKE